MYKKIIRTTCATTNHICIEQKNKKNITIIFFGNDQHASNSVLNFPTVLINIVFNHNEIQMCVCNVYNLLRYFLIHLEKKMEIF